MATIQRALEDEDLTLCDCGSATNEGSMDLNGHLSEINISNAVSLKESSFYKRETNEARSEKLDEANNQVCV